jgi:hypothetical protein
MANRLLQLAKEIFTKSPRKIICNDGKIWRKALAMLLYRDIFKLGKSG